MATTASLLKAGPVFMSWKPHQRQFCSRQISSNNNFLSLKKKSDHLNPRIPTEFRFVKVSSSIVSSNLRSELSRNYSKGCSNLHEDGIFGDLKKLVCSRNINLFGDDDVGSMSVIVEKLSRKFALQLAGLLLMMMAMALASRSKDSAFAASNGRMGGSISNSYSSSGSSSSSNSSSYYGCYLQHLSPEDQAISCIGGTLLIIFIIVIYLLKEREIGQGSVLMLQVGILDKKRVLQTKLNTIAESADTSTSRGLSQLLDGTLLFRPLSPQFLVERKFPS